jgi:50S ribosomal subunit-associated GTPase HflX
LEKTAIENWMTEENMIRIFNKLDLSVNAEDDVNRLREDYKNQFSCIHFVSGKTNHGIEELFLLAASKIFMKGNVIPCPNILIKEKNHNCQNCHLNIPRFHD